MKPHRIGLTHRHGCRSLFWNNNMATTTSCAYVLEPWITKLDIFKEERKARKMEVMKVTMHSNPWFAHELMLRDYMTNVPGRTTWLEQINQTGSPQSSKWLCGFWKINLHCIRLCLLVSVRAAVGISHYHRKKFTMSQSEDSSSTLYVSDIKQPRQVTKMISD